MPVYDVIGVNPVPDNIWIGNILYEIECVNNYINTAYFNAYSVTQVVHKQLCFVDILLLVNWIDDWNSDEG